MRTTLSALALVLAAAGCGSSGRDDQQQQKAAPSDDATSASPSPGPDPIVLRIARTGGTVRAFAYPRLDSAIWTSSDRAPAIGRVLAFDQEGGSLALVDAKGQPLERCSIWWEEPRPTSTVAIPSSPPPERQSFTWGQWGPARRPESFIMSCWL